MSFLKSIFKKDAPPPKPVYDEFSDLFSGMKVEVLTPANALIFVGRVRLLSGNQVDILDEKGGFPPRGLYNQPVKLRCFQRDGATFTLTGTVGPNDPKFWRIEKLQYLQNSENRSFFRQNIGVEGKVRSSGGQTFPCKVLDVSGGGVRVQTAKLFQLETTFKLEASFLDTEAPFSLDCLVKRISVRSQPSSPVKKFEYGCQFVDVPPREQERLLQVVFTLQRKSLRSRREQ